MIQIEVKLKSKNSDRKGKKSNPFKSIATNIFCPFGIVIVEKKRNRCTKNHAKCAIFL